MGKLKKIGIGIGVLFLVLIILVLIGTILEPTIPPSSTSTTQSTPPSQSIRYFSGNISKFALTKDDLSGLPLHKDNWWEINESEITDANNLTDYYVSPTDREDGWEGGMLVKMRYDNMNYASNPPYEDWQSFQVAQIILTFPVVNDTINSTKYFSVFLNSSETSIQRLLLNFDAATNFDDGNIWVSPNFQKLPSFGVGNSDFVYNYNETPAERLYGIVFVKENVLERISVYGVGTNLDILKDLATKAVNKIS